MKSSFSFYFLQSVFLFINIFFVVVIASIISFLHFRLNHPLNIIQNWIYHHNWEIFSFSKILSYLIIIKLFFVYDIKNINFKFIKKKYFFDNHVLVAISSIFFILIIIFSPLFNVQFEFFRIFYSSLCLGVSYIIDIVILVNLYRDSNENFRSYDMSEVEKKNKYNKNEKFILIPFFFIQYFIFFYLLKLLGLGLDSTSALLYSVNLFFLFLVYKNYQRIEEVLVFIIFLFLPLNIMFGFDLFWGNRYSLFKIKSNHSALYLILLLCISVFYLKLRSNKQTLT